jgi:hypothetical protein
VPARAEREPDADLGAPLLHRVEHHGEDADAAHQQRGERDQQVERVLLIDRNAPQHGEGAEDRHGFFVVGRDAEPVGQHPPHLALRRVDAVAVLRAGQDRAEHVHRQPRVRPEREMHAERHPELVVDLGAVARELRADAREHAHHLEGGAVDAHPAANAAFGAEQALARAVPDHEHAPTLRDVFARDQPPRRERHVADRLALRLDAAHLERERAPAERGGSEAPRLAGDAVELARALAQRLDVLLRVPEPAPIDRGREVLRDLPGPGLHQVLARALEGGVEHAAQADAPREQEDHGGRAPDQAEQRE